MNQIQTADAADEDWDESLLERVLEWYEKDPGEDMLGEERLGDDAFETLLEIFDPDEDEDPLLLDSYQVEEGDLESLQPLVHHHIDLDRAEYFVAAYRRQT